MTSDELCEEEENLYAFSLGLTPFLEAPGLWIEVIFQIWTETGHTSIYWRPATGSSEQSRHGKTTNNGGPYINIY